MARGARFIVTNVIWLNYSGSVSLRYVLVVQELLRRLGSVMATVLIR